MEWFFVRDVDAKRFASLCEKYMCCQCLLRPSGDCIKVTITMDGPYNADYCNGLMRMAYIVCDGRENH